jgi:cytosine/adenosine deaminase-related metal-dependent hydrolase
LSGPHVVLAHCVHLDTAEFETLAKTHTNVAHCPSSNLKLGSGIAEITRMLEAGISVSLGADGLLATTGSTCLRRCAAWQCCKRRNTVGGYSRQAGSAYCDNRGRQGAWFGKADRNFGSR